MSPVFISVLVLFTSHEISCARVHPGSLRHNVTAMALEAMREAMDWIDAMKLNEIPDQTSKGRGHSSDRFTKESVALEREQIIFDRAFQTLMESVALSFDDALSALTAFRKNKCSGGEVPHCDASKYRSPDGSCNNRLHPSWGQSGKAKTRLLEHEYEDGRSEPRGGLHKSRLPNPRFISTRLHPDIYVELPGLTNLVPAFGQFFDHDMTFTAQANIPCCSGRASNPGCWTISVPPDDYFYAPRGITCLDFVRSTACTDHNGTRQQLSMSTAFVDASQIYGHTKERASLLRARKGGKLLVNHKYPAIHLPLATELPGTLTKGDFISGDDRCNETPSLTVMHNLFSREHNRLAELIEQRRPGWDDERIYQEARRILGAEMQVIVYKEFLPIILGPHVMRKFGLEITRYNERSHNAYEPTSKPVKPVTPYTTYDPTVDPSVLNEFTAAAFRFGHTLVNGIIRMMNPLTQQDVGFFDVKSEYFRSEAITREGGRAYDYIMTSFLKTQAQDSDPFFTQAITNFLFREIGNDFGLDLVALNIQRGRDHGLRSYNDYRKYCGLAPINVFAPPVDIPRHLWKKLLSVYKDPDDIDLYSGGFHELRVNGGITGPTFQCIMVIQFQRMKYGDRYFFTHANQEGSFTLRQIQELSRRRMSDVICNNGIQPYVQANAFRTASSADNPYIDCTDPSRYLDIDLLLS